MKRVTPSPLAAPLLLALLLSLLPPCVPAAPASCGEGIHDPGSSGDSSRPDDPDRTEGAVTGDIYGQIKAHDLDGDGKKEILVGATDGMVHVYKYVTKKGQPAIEEVRRGAFPFQTAGPILGDVAVADTPDGKTRVFAGSMDGKVYCVDAKEGLKWTFATGGTITFSSPKVVPDEDGRQQVFVGSLSGKIFKLNENGEAVWSKSMPAPVVGPLEVSSDGAGGKEQVVVRDRDGNVMLYRTAEEAGPPAWQHKVSDGDGYWPVPLLSVDLNLDGVRETYTETDLPFKIVKLTDKPQPDLVREPLGKSSTQFTLADTDRDGYNELVTLENHKDDGCHLVVYDRFGKPRAGFPKKVGEYGSGAPKLADIDGDGDPDLLFTCWRKKGDGSLEGYLDALDLTGNRPKGYPKPIGKCVAPMTVVDLDGDGKVEILVPGGVGGSGGSIVLFRTRGRVPVRFEIVKKRFGIE